MIKSVFVSMSFSCRARTSTKCQHSQYLGKVGGGRLGNYSLCSRSCRVRQRRRRYRPACTSRSLLKCGSQMDQCTVSPGVKGSP
jgi:hypothetical protein